MKQYISCILFFLSVITAAQTIEKDWKFESIKNNEISIVEINTNDSLKLADGKFFYSLALLYCNFEWYLLERNN